MALSFPLAQSWFESLPIQTATFHLPNAVQVSRTRGGAIIAAPLAERLWQGTVNLIPQRNPDAAAIAARISRLYEAGASFLAYPVPHAAPAADPGGAALEGQPSPTIHTLADGGRELRIDNLPSGYVLSEGDFFGFTYGSNPIRYALHQITVGGTASISGLTPLMEVTPPIRSGAAVDAVVTLVKPPVKCVLTQTNPPTAASLFTSGLSLDFVQTLR